MITKEQLESWANHKSNKEAWIEEQERGRENWLLEYYSTEEDVMEDDDGEFIRIESSDEIEINGHPQPTGKMKKVYLPEEF